MRNAVIENGLVVNIIEGSIPNVTLIPADDKVRIDDMWDGASFFRTVPTREELKAQRQAKVDAITVTVNDKVFDGDEVSQERMARALCVADITNQTSCTWVLHDNTSATVTKEELAQALSLALQAQAAVWVIPA